jgi:hypothetical protein
MPPACLLCSAATTAGAAWPAAHEASEKQCAQCASCTWPPVCLLHMAASARCSQEDLSTHTRSHHSCPLHRMCAALSSGGTTQCTLPQWPQTPPLQLTVSCNASTTLSEEEDTAGTSARSVSGLLRDLRSGRQDMDLVPHMRQVLEGGVMEEEAMGRTGHWATAHRLLRVGGRDPGQRSAAAAAR